MRWRTWTTTAAGLALVYLPACGGGQDETVSAEPAPTSEVPASPATKGAPPSSSTVPTRRATTTTPTTPTTPTPDAGGSATPTTPTTPTTSATGGSATVESAGFELPSGGDVLQRHDAPPPGVPALLEFIAPHDVLCDGSAIYDSPTVKPTSSRSEVGQTVEICIDGFLPDQPVSVRISGPGGHTAQRPVENEDSWDYRVDPLDPTGAYEITAVQGAATERSGFTVGLPARPRVFPIAPTSGPAGTTFHFTVVGSAPNQTVPIDLYRWEGDFLYATTLDSVTTGDDGRVPYSLATGTGTAASRYCLVGRPFKNSCGEFRVR